MLDVTGKKWLRPREAAEYLGVKPEQLKDWRKVDPYKGPKFIARNPWFVRYEVEDLIKFREELHPKPARREVVPLVHLPSVNVKKRSASSKLEKLYDRLHQTEIQLEMPPSQIVHLDIRRFFLPMKNCAVIYFLCTRDQVLYIGKSVAMVSRIEGHVRECKRPFDRVYYMYVDETKFCLDDTEAAFIRHFNPPGNGIVYRRRSNHEAILRLYGVLDCT